MFPLRHKILLPLLLLLTHAAWCQPAAVKPNIIFIMADDLGYEALQCYGNDINKTPNLDKLAKEGMRFTQAHSTPLCTPTRVQVMTGKYNNRNYTGFGLLDKKEKTFAHYMNDAGYAIGITGKWQLLGNEKQQKLAEGKVGSRPEEVGFDKYCLWQVEELGSRFKNPTVTSNTGTSTHKGEYGPDIFTSFSLSFINDNRDRPFFLYYPMVLAHSPFEPTPDSPDYAPPRKKKINDPVYFKDMVEYMDKQVGRIVAEVEKLGMSERTLIIFTGDNGTGREIVSKVGGQEIKGGKGSTTKYGTNVPLIARWKGTIKPEQVNGNLIDFTDFLPTFMDVAGAKIPDNAAFDGLSFHKQLTNEETKVRDWIFCHYYPQWYTDFKAVWAHTKTWKLYSDGRMFNIEDDPLELKPVEEAALPEDGRKAKQQLDSVIKDYTTPEQ